MTQIVGKYSTGGFEAMRFHTSDAARRIGLKLSRVGSVLAQSRHLPSSLLRTFVFVGCLLFLTQPTPTLGQASDSETMTFATQEGHVEFRSSVPLHSFTGSSDALNGRIVFADSTVDFYVDVTTLKTGNGKRDKDMRKTLDAKQFPFAEFFGKLTTPFDPESTEPQLASVTGAFSIHGISHELTVNGTLLLDGDTLRLKAAWEISNKAYGIRPPKLLIMKVDDIQEVSIDVEMQRANS